MRHVSIEVKLNDGSGRSFSQVVRVPDDVPESYDSYTEARMDEWVTAHAQTMVLIDWRVAGR